jgi:hypothetical protein
MHTQMQEYFFVDLLPIKIRKVSQDKGHLLTFQLILSTAATEFATDEAYSVFIMWLSEKCFLACESCFTLTV